MKRLLLIFAGIVLLATVQAQVVGTSVIHVRQVAFENIISNGTFDDATGWTANTGWTIGSGVATYDDVSDGTALIQYDVDMNGSIVASQDYTISFDITIASGEAKIWILDESNSYALKASTGYLDGHHEYDVTAHPSYGGGISFYAYASSDNAFTIDNIIVVDR